MRLVDRHIIINRTHQYWRVCDELAFKSKSLYNLANYYCHQHFLGKLVKRGLFRSATGKVINADINGSLQILR